LGFFSFLGQREELLEELLLYLGFLYFFNSFFPFFHLRSFGPLLLLLDNPRCLMQIELEIDKYLSTPYQNIYVTMTSVPLYHH
jgi:hypothetical protein